MPRSDELTTNLMSGRIRRDGGHLRALPLDWNHAMSPMVSSPLTLEHALLGFVRHQPMHAYEIHQKLAQSTALGRVWHLKQSHLYALLGRLEEAGYVAATTEIQGARPPRKMLSLTPAGRAAFERWQVTPVAHGRDFRLEFLAKLYFADESGLETVHELIDAQRSVSNAWLADLRSQADALSADRRYDWLVLEFRIQQIEAILTWLDTCASALVPNSSGRRQSRAEGD
jgi:PadR family transcriptional regulator AphA